MISVYEELLRNAAYAVIGGALAAGASIAYNEIRRYTLYCMAKNLSAFDEGQINADECIRRMSRVKFPFDARRKARITIDALQEIKTNKYHPT